jgi:toxin CcdB
MARFDVYRHGSSAGYLLDCQADILSSLNTRVVVPLLPRREGPPPMAQLNPVFRVAGKEVVMYTQFAAAIPARELAERVGSLAAEDRTIMNAIDMLLSGC